MEASNPRAVFTTYEKELLLSFVESYKSIIENKQTNKITVEEKCKTWDMIREKFNSSSGTQPRSRKQLIQCYRNIKKRSAKAIANYNVSLRCTGGGDKVKSPEPFYKRVMAMNVLTAPMVTEFDSDAGCSSSQLHGVSDSDDGQMCSFNVEQLDSETYILPDIQKEPHPSSVPPSPLCSVQQTNVPPLHHSLPSCSALPARPASVTPAQPPPVCTPLSRRSETVSHPQTETQSVHETTSQARPSSARANPLHFFRRRIRTPAPSATAIAAAAIASEAEARKRSIELSSQQATVEHELKKQILAEQLKFYQKLNIQLVEDPSAFNFQMFPT